MSSSIVNACSQQSPLTGTTDAFLNDVQHECFSFLNLGMSLIVVIITKFRKARGQTILFSMFWQMFHAQRSCFFGVRKGFKIILRIRRTMAGEGSERAANGHGWRGGRFLQLSQLLQPR